MTDKKKELTEEELDNVNGGCGDKDMAEYLPADHGPHVGQFDAKNYLNRQFYIVSDDDREIWYWGELLKSYDSSFLGDERAYHTFRIDGKHDYWRGNPEFVGTEQKLSGNEYTLYLKN